MDTIIRPIASYATTKMLPPTSSAPTSSRFAFPQPQPQSKPQQQQRATAPTNQTPNTSNNTKTKCILPYAGVDLRKLPWDKVIEIMEKQAEVHRLYQINATCGYDWANQQNREYIETFNAQFKVEMERKTDPKLLPSFVTKCISVNEFYNRTSTMPGGGKRKISTAVPVSIKHQLNKEITAAVRKRKRSEPVYKGTDELKLLLQKERRVSHLDSPVFHYSSPSTSLLAGFGPRHLKTTNSLTSGSVSGSSIPVVAKFKIERYRDNNNCEFFDLTTDTDQDEQKSLSKLNGISLDK